jgi:PST family polysaccharide transporter
MSGWRPGFVFAWTRVRPLIRFGGALTLTRLLGYAGRTLDRVLIGRFLDAAALGIYTKAGGWLLSPLQMLTFPLSRVAVATLSRLQDDALRYRAYFRTAADGIALLLVPILAFAMLEAEAIVHVFLGKQWVAGVPIFRILLPVSVGILVRMFTLWVFVSTGRVGRQFRWEAFVLAVSIPAFAIGLRGGIVGIACAYSGISLVMLVPSAIYCARGSVLVWRDILSPILLPGGASTLAACMAFVLFAFAEPMAPAVQLVASLALFSLLYAAILIAIPFSRRRLLELRGHFRLR